MSVHIELTSIESLVSPSFVANIKEDGTFSFENVGQGKYIVSIRTPTGTYAKSARYAQNEILGKEFMISGDGGDLTIVVRDGSAQIEGKIDEQDGSHGAPTYFLIVPANLAPDGSGLYLGHTDTNGAFKVSDLSPGQYRAYAFASVDFSALQNRNTLKAIESLGTVINLEERDQSTVTLRVLSPADVRRAIGSAVQ